MTHLMTPEEMLQHGDMEALLQLLVGNANGLGSIWGGGTEGHAGADERERIRAAMGQGAISNAVQAAVAVTAARAFRALREAAPQLPDGVLVTIVKFCMNGAQGQEGMCCCPMRPAESQTQRLMPDDEDDHAFGDDDDDDGDDEEQEEDGGAPELPPVDLAWVSETSPLGCAVCSRCCRPCVTEKGQRHRGNTLPFWGSHERVCRENPNRPFF